jgi:hypothetical protein
MKDIGGLRKLRHRGRAKVAAIFTFACARLQPGASANVAGGAVFGVR